MPVVDNVKKGRTRGVASRVGAGAPKRKPAPKRKAAPKRQPDKYDRAIAYLEKHPTEIGTGGAWSNPANHPAGCLFAYTSPYRAPDWVDYGCLTQVRIGLKPGPTPALTKAIRADKRIPSDAYDITLSHLPVFAEWQRRLDKALGVDRHVDRKGVVK